MRSEEVKKRNLAITSMSVILLATVAISMITTTDNAFASNEMYSSGVIQAVASSETETPQEACEECFDGLSSDQQDNFLERVGQELFNENPPMTLEEFCVQMSLLTEDELVAAIDDIIAILDEIGLEEDTQSIERCLVRALG